MRHLRRNEDRGPKLCRPEHIGLARRAVSLGGEDQSSVAERGAGVVRISQQFDLRYLITAHESLTTADTPLDASSGPGSPGFLWLSHLSS